MICRGCMIRLHGSRIASGRIFSTSSSFSKLNTLSSSRAPPSGSHEGPPAATSTSAAQPFSTPTTPSPAPSSPPSQSSPGPGITSTVPAGTPLKGLGYFKGKDPPIAKEDHEYPAWLWGLLDEGKEGDRKDAEEVGDSYCKPTGPASFENIWRCLGIRH